MERYTQSNLDPGNCWQTCVACLLEVAPDSLPPQCEIEATPHSVLNGWGSYHNALNGYLDKHHNLLYQEMYYWQMELFRPYLDYHMLIGPTVRSKDAEARGLRHTLHCVIGFNGIPCWDPHPSRAGLLQINSYGLLIPLSERFRQERHTRKDDPLYRLVFEKCICPACYLDEFRALRRKYCRENTKSSGNGQAIRGVVN